MMNKISFKQRLVHCGRWETDHAPPPPRAPSASGSTPPGCGIHGAHRSPADARRGRRRAVVSLQRHGALALRGHRPPSLVPGAEGPGLASGTSEGLRVDLTATSNGSSTQAGEPLATPCFLPPGAQVFQRHKPKHGAWQFMRGQDPPPPTVKCQPQDRS